MKTISIALILSLVISPFINAQEKLVINTSKSQIKWIGEYTFYFGGHEGYIDIKEGYFLKTGEKLSGGEFVIDMHSITCTDIDKADANESLVNHLKDPDFFDVEKYPLATLKITEVTYHDSTHMEIKADLTIKAITKPITFQAEVDYNKQEFITKFKIDRMLWDVSYNSDIRDGAISDAIGFEVKLSL